MNANPPGRRTPLRGAIGALREARWITPRRLLLCGCGCAVLAVFLVVVGVRFFTINGLLATNGTPLGNDFIQYYTGAAAAADGHARLVYDNQWFLASARRVVGPMTRRIYSYPPVMLLQSLPLALFSYVPALIVWTLLGIGSAFALLRRLVGWKAAAVAVVGAPAAFFNLANGNTGYFGASLLGGGLMLLQRRPVIAGICFGCLAYKPHLGLLLPFALAADARWRAIAAAAVTLALLGAASVALFGTATWAAFSDQMAVNLSLLKLNWSLWYSMVTVFAAAREIGATPALADIAQLVSAAGALAAIVIVWRHSGPSEIKAAALTVAIFLATPYAFFNDTVVLLFAAAWLGREGVRTGFLPWERIAIVALLALPVLTIAAAKLAGIPIAPLVLWLGLGLLVRRAVGKPVALPAVAG